MQNNDTPDAVMFPLLRFVVKHLFESIALAIALTGTFAYAFGMAFYDGWNAMSGIPVAYFQYTTYEIVRKGIGVPGPWFNTAMFAITVLVYIFGMNAWETWSRQKRMTKGRMASAQAAKAVRRNVGFNGRHSAPADQEWRSLGKRGLMTAPLLKAKTATKLRRKALVADLVRMFMPIIFMIVCLVGYKVFYLFGVQTSVVEGRKAYLQLYIAVVGKLPPSLVRQPKVQDLLDNGCVGLRKLKNYIAVNLQPAGGDGVDSAYLIETSGNNFILLSSTGLKIKSFGDSGYELVESTKRPISPLMKSCPEED